MQAAAKDLRFHTREILEAVSRGEVVVITFRGRPRAKVVPIRERQKTTKPTPAMFGLWRDYPGVADVGRFVRKIRKGRFR